MRGAGNLEDNPKLLRKPSTAHTIGYAILDTITAFFAHRPLRGLAHAPFEQLVLSPEEDGLHLFQEHR
jgi:hypothetical protein